MPSKNITVADNRLGTGMGISVGSSVSGGVEDVLYIRNVMNETAGQWGMGVHIKTRTTYGGYIRNIAYVDNVFETAGVPGGAIHIESGYQSGQGNSCSQSECTDIRDIVFRNLSFGRSGGTGVVTCFPNRFVGKKSALNNQKNALEDTRFPHAGWVPPCSAPRAPGSFYADLR